MSTIYGSASAANVMFNKNNPSVALSTAAAPFTPLIDGSDLKAYYRFSESSSPFENLAGNVTDNDSIGSSGDLDVNDGGDPNHIEYEESTVAGEIPSVALWSRTDVNDGAYADASTASDWSFLNYGASADSLKWSVCWWFKTSSVVNNTTIFTTTPNSGAGIGLMIYLTDWNGAGVELGILGRAGAGTGVGYCEGICGVNFVDPDNSWHFYSATFDETLGSENLKVKRDNANEVTFGKISASTSGSPNYPLTIEHQPAGGYFPALNNMAETSFWNRVLTDAQITSIYNSGNGAPLYS